MLDHEPSNTFPREPYGSFNCEITVPRPEIGLVFLLLVALAGLGAYKGVTAGHRGPGSSLLNPSVEGKPVDASQVVPIVRDTDWSTLKGPQILTPPSAQPAAKEAADDSNDNDAPDTADASKDASPSTVEKPAPDAPPTGPDHAAATP